MSGPWTERRGPLRQALILGTGREPLQVPEPFSALGPERGALAMLGALAWRSRFDRLSPPEELRSYTSHSDPARVLPEPMRALLRALVEDSVPSPPVATEQRIARELWERDRHVHPFDHPLLSRFLRRTSQWADPGVKQWLSRPWIAREDSEAEEEDADSSFAELPLPERLQSLRTLRSVDAPAARALCVEALSQETAAGRQKLVQTLEVGLGSEDRDCLESLRGDRAKSVRDSVAELLARIPGTEEFEARLEEARARIEVGSAGLLGRKAVVKVDAPGHLSAEARRGWIFDTFRHVDLERLAGELGLRLDRFLAAVTELDFGCFCFLALARAGAMVEAGGFVERHGPALLRVFAREASQELSSLDAAARGSVLDLLVRPADWREVESSLEDALLLSAALERKWPDEAVRALLESRAFRKFVEQATQEAVDTLHLRLERLVAAVDARGRALLVERLASLPLAVTVRPRTLATLLDQLEAFPRRPDEPTPSPTPSPGSSSR